MYAFFFFTLQNYEFDIFENKFYRIWKIFFKIMNVIHMLLCNCIAPTSGVTVSLTHWVRVTHTCVSTLTIIGSDNGLSPGWWSHYLNLWWNFVNWTPRNKLQSNFNQNSNIFIEQNAFENVVWKMMAIFLGLNVLKRFLKIIWMKHLNSERLDQVMVWFHQALRHYMNRCSPSLLASYNITRDQRVKIQWQ